MTTRAGTGALCPEGRRRIPAQVWDAAEKAKALIEAARSEARAIVAAATDESERARAEAAVRGREEAFAAATETIARAAIERERLIASCSREVVELAFEIASRVLARAVERDREAVLDVAARALSQVRNRVDVTLRVHPDDLEAVRDGEPQLLERLSRSTRIAIAADATVGRGGAVVETETVSVDARIATQLEALRAALEEAAS